MSTLWKRHATTLALVAIMALGLSLRLRRIDHPPIGYHSMKEVHYLSVAKGYLDYGDFAHKRVLYSGMSEGPGYIEGLPQFQILPLIFFSLWKIFGVSIWLARLVVIAFSVGNSALMYFLARRLGGGGGLSLLGALLMAILPLSVFFGRNIQPDAPALFFLLLSTLFYLEWLKGLRARHLALFSAAVFMMVITKGTFLFMLVPLLFLFPYRILSDATKRKLLARQMLWPVFGVVLCAAWLLFTKSTLSETGTLFPSGRLFLPHSATSAYWREQLPIVWKYVGDNFTYLYSAFFAVGLFAAFLDWRSPMSLYILGSLVAAVLYFVTISDFAVRHSYYHMPFLPMVCLGIAAAVDEASSFIGSKLERYPLVKYAIPVLILLLGAPGVKASLDRHFDIQILGIDVAGRYIREHGGPDDRIFISYGSPSDGRFAAWRTLYYGVLWEAGKRGSLLPKRLDEIRLGEDERNMRWILLYKTQWLPLDQPILDYIRAHYSIMQIGYRDGNVIYYLLHRGGAFDPAPFESLDSHFARRYRFSTGPIDLYAKERREALTE
jgi:hypothetical protein